MSSEENYQQQKQGDENGLSIGESSKPGNTEPLLNEHGEEQDISKRNKLSSEVQAQDQQRVTLKEAMNQQALQSDTKDIDEHPHNQEEDSQINPSQNPDQLIIIGTKAPMHYEDNSTQINQNQQTKQNNHDDEVVLQHHDHQENQSTSQEIINDGQKQKNEEFEHRQLVSNENEQSIPKQYHQHQQNNQQHIQQKQQENHHTQNQPTQLQNTDQLPILPTEQKPFPEQIPQNIQSNPPKLNQQNQPPPPSPSQQILQIPHQATIHIPIPTSQPIPQQIQNNQTKQQNPQPDKHTLQIEAPIVQRDKLKQYQIVDSTLQEQQVDQNIGNFVSRRKSNTRNIDNQNQQLTYQQPKKSKKLQQPPQLQLIESDRLDNQNQNQKTEQNYNRQSELMTKKIQDASSKMIPKEEKGDLKEGHGNTCSCIIM